MGSRSKAGAITGLALLAAAAPQTAAALGPPKADLARVLASTEKLKEPPVLRHTHCTDFPEEPTEYACTFERRDGSGRWAPWAAIVTWDGDWDLLDLAGPCRTKAEAEKFDCPR